MLRVLYLGASTVEGFPMPRNLTSARFLEEMLRETIPDREVEVLNLGVAATQHLRALKQIADRVGPVKGAWKAEWNEIQSAAARLEGKQRRSGSDVET